MILIDTGIYDPWFNIAVEEFLFREFKEEIIYLYINDKSVIVGKHQNIYEEINPKFIRQNNIPVIRRISGGGTVYHDKGNLNFTFIRNSESGKQIDFSRYVSPVVSFLKASGLNPEIGEKNEIKEGGVKFSGNAEHIFKNRVLHHGTILYSSDLASIEDSIQKGRGSFESKAVQSNRTSAGNLDKKLENIKNTEDLKNKLVDHIILNSPGIIPYNFNENEVAIITRLVQSKYKTWDWNYAYGPGYTFKNIISTRDSQVGIHLKVKDGIITECTTDGNDNWSDLPYMLTGKRHLFDDIRSGLKELSLPYDDDIVCGFLS